MVITFLSGSRPEYLRQSLLTTFEYCPEIKNDNVLIFNNSGDAETESIIDEYEDRYNVRRMRSDTILPIGEALSLLAEYAANSGEKYWASFEDDFICTNNQLDEAVHILAKYEEVSQVRLRREDDGGLNYHMVTKNPLRWKNRSGFKSCEGHRTFNNNLIRTEDIWRCFPCSGERDAQKKWHEKGMVVVAQLQPGMFKHIGDESLRTITKCEP